MVTDPPSKAFLRPLTERIVQTYSEPGAINHLGHSPLPQHDRVVAAIGCLQELLFPGYQRRERLHLGNIIYHVGDLIDMLHDLLTEQFGRALQHEDRAVHQGIRAHHDWQAQARQTAETFLNRLPTIRQILATDVQAAYDGDPACHGLDEVILCYPGFQAVTVYRLAHEIHLLQIPFIPRMMTEWAHQQTGIDIHPGASIGEHFFIDHGTGVVVGETCIIGRHVKLYQGVTLGALSFDTDTDGKLVRGQRRHPTVEDRVVIYANATVLGGNTVIGHHAIIGSSVWLTRSVDPYTTVTIEQPNLRMRSVPDLRRAS